MDEIWLPVLGYGDAYSVSSLGRVMRTSPRNIYRRPTGSRAKPFTPTPVKAFKTRGGYMQVRIGPSGAQESARVHRLVACAFLPNPLNLHDVNHIDGDKTNNTVSNLEWVSRRDNVLHAMRLGMLKHPRGELAFSAKLSEKDVLAIRCDTRIQRLIAADYGVDQTLVSMIKLRKIWTDL